MSVDVEQLTRDHKRAVHTVDGIEFHTVPSLLSQLRDAVLGAVAADGGSGSAKSKLPFQAAALDLYMLIEQQILIVWVEQFPQVPPATKPETLISQWAAKVTGHTVVNFGTGTMNASELVTRWVGMIQDYFDPPRLAEIQAPCPVCQERYTYRDVDGEQVRSAALGFRRDRDTGETLDARCTACDTTWTPTQFRFLAEMIGAEAKET